MTSSGPRDISSPGTHAYGGGGGDLQEAGLSPTSEIRARDKRPPLVSPVLGDVVWRRRTLARRSIYKIVHHEFAADSVVFLTITRRLSLRPSLLGRAKSIRSTVLECNLLATDSWPFFVFFSINLIRSSDEI